MIEKSAATDEATLMEIRSDWLVRGFFDLAEREGGESLTQRVKAKLEEALGRPLRLANYPVGPTWRYNLWWRERDID